MCLWCYSECISTLGALKNLPDHSGNRTRDLWFASPMLCSTELRGQVRFGYIFHFLSVLMDDCKECNSKFAHCFHGKCVCKPGYVGDGKICVPKLPGKYIVCIPDVLTEGIPDLSWVGETLKVRSHGATNRRDMLQGHVAGSNFIVCHRSKPCRGDKKLSPRHAA